MGNGDGKGGPRRGEASQSSRAKLVATRTAGKEEDKRCREEEEKTAKQDEGVCVCVKSKRDREATHAPRNSGEGRLRNLSSHAQSSVWCTQTVGNRRCVWVCVYEGGGKDVQMAGRKPTLEQYATQTN